MDSQTCLWFRPAAWAEERVALHQHHPALKASDRHRSGSRMTVGGSHDNKHMLHLPELMKSLFLDNLLFVVIWIGVFAQSGTHLNI